jgi:hypothetical protein
MEKIPRSQAIRLGLAFYCTGDPCKHGHIAERRTSNRLCTECERIKSRKAREADPEKRRLMANSRRSMDLESYRLKEAKYYEANKEKIRARKAEWRRKNADRIRKIEAAYRASNAEACREKVRKYCKTENGRTTTRKVNSARRARITAAVPVWFGELDELVASEAARLAVIREAATGIKWHIDHMIPLAASEASGLHCAANLQVIPAKLNHSKHNRMVFTEPREWIQRL